ncbi:MAG: trypsin-like peptidase domain-containing protein [Rubripirellula sp.]
MSGNVGASDGILIDFSSPHCGPCQAMQPTLAQLAQSGVVVRHVDVVAEPHLAARYGIRKTPTFVVVSGGKEVTRLIGTQSLGELKAALAINPLGQRVQTGAMSQGPGEIQPPQTRLAPPVGGVASRGDQTLTSAAAAPSSEPMPSMSLADAVERARAATVRLRVHDGNGYGAGTGTIIDTHGDQALVLTCGHLFRDNKGEGKIEVDLYVGGQTRTVLGKVLDFDADTRDIALVTIQPGFAIQAVDVIGPQEKVRNGQTAFSYGCDRGDDPSRRDTRITGINKYDQHLGVSNLEIAGAPIDGRSGGGLFDESGRLIGVCNAADYKGDVGIYAGPGSVHWQLDRVGLSALYQSTSPAAGQIASTNQPAERIASLPGSDAALSPSVMQPSAIAATGNPSSAVMPAAMSLGSTTGGMNTPPVNAIAANQEVIVIVRDRDNPSAETRVMTLQQPSTDLMQMIQQHAR